jgi:subtilisin family serine protease
MNKILLIFALLFPLNAYPGCQDKPITIAVVDTGFGYAGAGKGAHLCSTGHRDFSSDNKSVFSNNTIVPLDVHGHGTNITGIIESYLKKEHINYCIVVIKYFSEKARRNENLYATINAFNYIADQKFDYVNYSGGGDKPDHLEKMAVLRYLDEGGHLITAAGNEGKNLSLFCNQYYPAMYDKRIVVVGNLNQNGTRAFMSNYGKAVNRWEIGMNVAAYGLTMSGTSQATALATSKIVSQNTNKCDKVQ